MLTEWTWDVSATYVDYQPYFDKAYLSSTIFEISLKGLENLLQSLRFGFSLEEMAKILLVTRHSPSKQNAKPAQIDLPQHQVAVCKWSQNTKNPVAEETSVCAFPWNWPALPRYRSLPCPDTVPSLPALSAVLVCRSAQTGKATGLVIPTTGFWEERLVLIPGLVFFCSKIKFVKLTWGLLCRRVTNIVWNGTTLHRTCTRRFKTCVKSRTSLIWLWSLMRLKSNATNWS